MLFGLSVNLTPQEAEIFHKVLTGLKEKKIQAIGVQFEGDESLFFNLATYDFDCQVNSQNKQMGTQTLIDSMYAIQVKGTVKEMQT
jgi:hypothetical protein